MSNIQVRRIAHAMGAEVTGVDLSQPLDDASFAAIKRASLDHLLLCFPGQKLTREQMIAFARRFGVVDDNATVKHRDPKNPYVTMLSSKPFEGKPWEGFKNGENWHTDRSYRTRPTSYTLLHALEMPTVGGNTMFANQYMSYNSLSPKLRAFVDGLSAIHLQTRKASAVMSEQFPAVIHPLAREHPETNQKALYIGEHVRGFIDMTEDESRPFLDFLTAHATRLEFCYRHIWRVHDLVMWDNRCLMHVAVRDYDMGAGAQPRHLWKCSVHGEVTGRLYQEVIGRRHELEIAERPAASAPPVMAGAAVTN